MPSQAEWRSIGGDIGGFIHRGVKLKCLLSHCLEESSVRILALCSFFFLLEILLSVYLIHRD